MALGCVETSRLGVRRCAWPRFLVWSSPMYQDGCGRLIPGVRSTTYLGGAMNRKEIRLYTTAGLVWLVAFLGIGGAFVS